MNDIVSKVVAGAVILSAVGLALEATVLAARVAEQEGVLVESVGGLLLFLCLSYVLGSLLVSED